MLNQRFLTRGSAFVLALLLLVLVYPQTSGNIVQANSASNPFQMQNGLLVVEIESAPPADDWEIRTELSGASGSYYYWNYPNAINRDTSIGVMEYHVNISEAGRYRFQLRSARGPIDNNTEENDAFIRVMGTGSEAIAIKSSTGDQVSMGNDWFKVYQNERGRDWTWRTAHVDNNAHNVYLEFDSAGVYVVGVTGRSQKFSVDRWVVYDEDQYSEGEATDLGNAESPTGDPVTETPTEEPTTEVPTEEPTTTTPEPTEEPTTTATPEPTEDPTTPTIPPEDIPTAPTSLTVDPNNGRPIISWPEDPNAEWFNIWIIGQLGISPLRNAWFPIPGAVSSEGVEPKVICNNGTCTLMPNINPVGGTYDLWIRSWGNGAFSTGGNSQYDGWSTFTFSLPTDRPNAPTDFSASLDNGVPTLTWTGQPFVTWYQIWLGTAEPLTQSAFQFWTSGEAFGCANPGTCTFTPDVTLTTGAYVVWMQSWGPGGFNQSDRLDGWVEVGTFNIP